MSKNPTLPAPHGSPGDTGSAKTLLRVSGLTKHFPIHGGFPFRRKVGAVRAVDGLDLTRDQVEQSLRVDREDWKAEVPDIAAWFEKFGDKLPTALWAELDGLRARVGL